MRRDRGSLKAEGFNEVKTISPIFRLPQLCLFSRCTACQQAVRARGQFSGCPLSRPRLAVGWATRLPAVAKGNIFRLPQTQAKILRQPENSFAPLDWRRVCGFATHHLFSMAKLCVAACAAHPTYLPKCRRKIKQPETQWSGDGSSPNS